MAASNLIAFFIILTTAVTLHEAGVRSVDTAAQAAEALRPVAGNLAFLLFSIGIVGTGLLALPVLAGSSAFAVGELRGWRVGLERKPGEARWFYGVIAAAFLLGLGATVAPIDPIKALFWSAVLNGIVAVPVMIAMLLVAANRKRMGAFVATPLQKFLGWATVAAMTAAVLVMLIA